MMKKTMDSQPESASSIIPKAVILIEADANSTVVELNTNAALCSYKVAEIREDGKTIVLDENTVALQLAGSEYPNTDGKVVLVVEEVSAGKSRISVSRISLNSSKLFLFVCQWPVDVGIASAIKELRDSISIQQDLVIQKAQGVFAQKTYELVQKTKELQEALLTIQHVTGAKLQEMENEIGVMGGDIQSLKEEVWKRKHDDDHY